MVYILDGRRCKDVARLFQLCPVPGKEAISTNWNTRDSIWMFGSIYLLCGWLRTGTKKFPKEMVISVLENTEKPPEHGPGQASLDGLSSAESWTRWTLEDLPTSAILTLWFCETANHIINCQRQRQIGPYFILSARFLIPALLFLECYIWLFWVALCDVSGDCYSVFNALKFPVPPEELEINVF